MNKNYDDDATQFVDSPSMTQEMTTPDQQEDKQEEKKEHKSSWKQPVMGAASGLLVGTLSSVLMGMGVTEAYATDNEGTNTTRTTDQNGEAQPDWADNQMAVATTVNDDMSFGEAFAAARNEVGPGGAFEWHGQVYNTYTAEEWNNMTAEQRAEYSDHFNWNRIDHTTSDVAQHSTTANTTAEAQVVSADDDIEVVSVNHEENAQTSESQVAQAEYTESGAGESEVEILGVVHDAESGMNIGAMSVGGEEVILVDVDNDMTFDYMAADANNNGTIDGNEMVDIQSEYLTVNDLGGMANDPTGDMLASNSGPDYTSDAVYEA